MCVAVYKPAGVKMPDKATFQSCWDTNPDGAGFAYRSGGKIQICKGFMKFEKFWDAVKRFENCSGEMFYHFRIATHGGICPENTHPFPVSSDIRALQGLTVSTDACIIHNGILPTTPEHPGISDTMQCIKNIAESGIDTAKAIKLIEPFLGGSKIALMTREKTILAGDWHDVDGVKYSNTHWDWGADFEDDYTEYFPSDGELKMLEANICPDCRCPVELDRGEWYCENCGAIYIKPKQTWNFWQ